MTCKETEKWTEHNLCCLVGRGAACRLQIDIEPRKYTEETLTYTTLAIDFYYIIIIIHFLFQIHSVSILFSTLLLLLPLLVVHNIHFCHFRSLIFIMRLCCFTIVCIHLLLWLYGLDWITCFVYSSVVPTTCLSMFVVTLWIRWP